VLGFFTALVLLAVPSAAGVLLPVLAQPLSKNPRSNTDKVESLTGIVIFVSISVVLLLAGIERRHYRTTPS
jgi:hypothetical protein